VVKVRPIGQCGESFTDTQVSDDACRKRGDAPRDEPPTQSRELCRWSAGPHRVRYWHQNENSQASIPGPTVPKMSTATTASEPMRAISGVSDSTRLRTGRCMKRWGRGPSRKGGQPLDSWLDDQL